MEETPIKLLLKAQNPVQTSTPAPYFPKKSKHAPKELPSTVPVSRFKKIKFPKAGDDPEKGIFVQKAKRRDPRFDNLSGKLNEDLFEKSYDFLDEYLEKEIEALQEALNDRKQAAQHENIKAILQQKQAQFNRIKEGRRQRDIKRSLVKKEKKAIQQGKTPFYFKKTAIKHMAMKERLSEMEKEGKLGKYKQHKMKRQRSKVNKEYLAAKRRKVAFE